MTSDSKYNALIEILKHDANDKKYKAKDFENWEKIKEKIKQQQDPKHNQWGNFVSPHDKNKNT